MIIVGVDISKLVFYGSFQSLMNSIEKEVYLKNRQKDPDYFQIGSNFLEEVQKLECHTWSLFPKILVDERKIGLLFQ